MEVKYEITSPTRGGTHIGASTPDTGKIILASPLQIQAANVE